MKCRAKKALVTSFVLLMLLSACKNDAEPSSIEERTEPISVAEVPERYGIPEKSYKIYDGKIEKNQFLSDILLGYGVPYGNIASLETVAKDVHDVRKLKAGDQYAMFCAKDSGETACFFIVETSPADYVVYKLNDTIAAYVGQKPITRKVREAGGVINSSLYQTIADNELPVELAAKLNEIYAWTVDFYRIQKGDYFKVVFEETYVDDKPMGVGKVMAAEFGHRGEAIQSFRFEQVGAVSFFDADGESLRKAFLQAPLKFSRISSKYSLKRYHPVQKRWKAHLGTDYAAPSGTPILATGDGTVIASAYGRYNGNYVKIKHNGTYTTQYLHMSKRATKKGDRVSQGEVIGYVGSTGLATGPHVCYRFWKNGNQVDPYQQDLPPSEPIPAGEMANFKALIDRLLPRLHSIKNQVVEKSDQDGIAAH